MSARDAALDAVRRWAEGAGDEVEAEVGTRAGETVVVLPGEHRLRTPVSVVVGEHGLSVTAFVVRRPDEDAGRVHRWLLERNARQRHVAFALDGQGDVFLVGRLPLAGVDEQTLDALLGEVLDVADGSFDELLAMGFHSSIRREWAWRTARGEPTRNLEAFVDVLGLRDDGPPPAP